MRRETKQEMKQEGMKVAASDYIECPVCGGTGIETYTEMVSGIGEAIYGRPCSKCGSSRRLVDSTGIPKEYHDTDYTKFDFSTYDVNLDNLKKVTDSFVNDYLVWEKRSKGIYLWSKTPGSGKTFLACSMAKSIMVKHNLHMRFITAPDYITLVGDSYNRERGETDPSEVYRSCRLLVFDDIGAQMGKEWHRQELFRLIDDRMKEGNVTIFTSNSDSNKLNVDIRTIDRINSLSIVLQMPEESIRKKKASKAQEDFLKSILQTGA